MFGKIKKILGIESVKIELIIPESINKNALILQGEIKLTSLSDDNKIEKIHVKLTEKYARGRGNDQLINEYLLGEITTKPNISIGKQDVIDVPFSLDFIYVESEMDKIGSSNIFTRGIVGLAKKIRNVKSEYFVTAECYVRGTTLNPVVSKGVQLK